MKPRIVSLLFCALVLLSFGVIVGSALRTSQPSSFSQIGTWANRIVRDELKKIPAIEQLAPSLMLLGGAKEQDGIFITEDYLLENITPTDDDLLEENVAGMEDFLDRYDIPAAVVLIPTAVAIKQQEIPVNAELYNQKAMITDVYNRLNGRASTIDAYTSLFSARDEYTYYRTASNLTGLGGYYVYTAIASRMDFTARPLNQFEIEHLSEDYYGDLYARSSYKGTQPDLLTLYRYTRSERLYRLTCIRDEQERTYYSLFPTHLEELDRPEDVILGGYGQIIDISVVSPYDDSLLILTDDTALSFLPFLVIHYGHVTAVNTTTATKDQLAAIDPEKYDHVLFAYSVKTMLQEDAGTSRFP
jgi:hypothetical protein